MSTARELPSATLLADGRVLVAGGSNASGVLATTEIFDPVANSWTTAETMISPRVLHSATLLGDGRVLAAGGLSGAGTGTAEAAARNCTTRLATPGRPPRRYLMVGCMLQGAVLLPSGKVLQLGQAAEIYDPVANTWADSQAGLRHGTRCDRSRRGRRRDDRDTTCQWHRIRRGRLFGVHLGHLRSGRALVDRSH